MRKSRKRPDIEATGVKGYLKEKRDADFVIVDEKYRIQSTFVKGKKVF